MTQVNTAKKFGVSTSQVTLTEKMKIVDYLRQEKLLWIQHWLYGKCCFAEAKRQRTLDSYFIVLCFVRC